MINLFRTPAFISALLGVFPAVGGLITLLGWFANVPALTDWNGNGISMMPNAALCAVCSGVALFCSAISRWRLAVVVLGIFVACLGGATLFEYLSGIDLGIDRLLIYREWGQRGTVAPGRMGPPGSTSWTFLGIAFILLSTNLKTRRFALACALLVMTIATLSLLGYLYGADPLYTIPRLTTIALQTATMLLALAIGIVAALPQHQPMATLLADTTAGMLARRSLPFIVLLPLFVGYVRLRGQMAGLYDTAFGTALRTIVELAAFAGLLWWTLQIVSAKERALKESERQVRFTTDHAPVLIVHCDAEGRYKFVNMPYAQRFGLDPKRVVGRRIPDVVGDAAYNAFRQHVEAALAGKRAEFEAEIPYQQIGAHWMHCVYVPDRDADGAVIGFVAVIQDVTARRQAQEALRQSEQRLRLFIEHAPAALAMFDRQMRYIAASHRWKTDYDISGNILGRSHYEVFPELPERWKEIHRRALAGETLRADEDPFQRSDGSTQWVKWEVHPWYAGDEIGGILISAEDVTARVLAQRALREREAVLSTVTNEARVGLVLVNKDRRYLFANATYAQILALPNSDIVGKRVADVLAPVYDQISPRLDRAFAGERVQYELHMPSAANGQERFYDVIYEPRIDTPDPYVVVVIVDITERKKMAESLERQVAERTASLKETTEQLNTFVHSIAHDLRSPLRAQQGYAEILVTEFGEALGEEGKQFARRISTAATRFDHLVSDLLDYATLSRADLQLTPIELEPLLHQARADLADLISDRKGTVLIEPGAFRVLAHGPTLNLIVNNLLSNALKYSQPGVPPKVRVRAEPVSPRYDKPQLAIPTVASDRPRVRIFFEDNGIGIAPENLERIFGVFERLHSKDKYPGTGIGLAIVRKGVERMGGSVGLRSEPGKGSTFWIELPQP